MQPLPLHAHTFLHNPMQRPRAACVSSAAHHSLCATEHPRGCHTHALVPVWVLKPPDPYPGPWLACRTGAQLPIACAHLCPPVCQPACLPPWTSQPVAPHACLPACLPACRALGAAARSNLVIALGDLAVRFPNVSAKKVCLARTVFLSLAVRFPNVSGCQGWGPEQFVTPT